MTDIMAFGPTLDCPPPMISTAIRALALASAAGFGISAWAAPAAGAPWVVTYPSSGAVGDKRGDYYVSLLKLALDKADGNFEVQSSTNPSVATRAFVSMATGRGIDVIWAPTTIQLEHDYLPVRIPLDKGILGWRIFLIGESDRGLFEGIRSVKQLKALPAGQVREWVDTDILRGNGFPVVAATRYENLFTMLAAQRFRYLPRGVGEIYDEARNHGHLGLTVEPHLALHYPMCTYFFVAKQNTELAQRIELGLRRANKDGSFEQLFQQFYGQALQAAKLDGRLVFTLERPTAPPTCVRSAVPQ